MGKQCKAMRKADGQHKPAQYMVTRKHGSDGLPGGGGGLQGVGVCKGVGGTYIHTYLHTHKVHNLTHGQLHAHTS